MNRGTRLSTARLSTGRSSGRMNQGITLGASTITYQVTVESVYGSNKYFIDGTQQATLSLTEGNTYIFNWSSATGHPLKFSTTADGTHGGGSEYTTGVTVDSSNYKTTIVVAANTPNLFYYCSNHSGMGGTANTPNASGGSSSGGSSSGGSSGGGGGTPTTETYTVAARQTIRRSTGNQYTSQPFLGEMGYHDRAIPRPRGIHDGGHRPYANDILAGGQRTDDHTIGRTHSAANYYNSSADNYDSMIMFNFANVNIKQGATISNAKLSFKKGPSVGSLASGQSDLFKIHAPLTDDSDWLNNPVDTGTQVDWTGLFAATNNTTVESPDISSVIQEIVNIPTWQSGNSFQICLFFAASSSQNQRATINVKTGYDHDDSPNSDGAPQLELTHTGGSDYAGTIIEGVERESFTSYVNNIGSSFYTNNTINNTGTYSSTSANNDGSGTRYNQPYVGRSLSFRGYYNSSADAQFKAFAVRFPNIPLVQGATVPTTKLSFVILNHKGMEAGELGISPMGPNQHSVRQHTLEYHYGHYLSRDYWNAHSYETGHHALNGDGTNDAVGVRIRAVKLTDVPANFSGMTHSDFNHPSGTTETGVSTVTDAFVDLSLEDYYTESLVYDTSNAANEYEGKYMKVTHDQPRFETPDMKNILQEIVNQSGWSSGNAIALLFYLPSFHTGAVAGTTAKRVDGLSFAMVAGNHKGAVYHQNGFQWIRDDTSTFNALSADQKKFVGRMPKLLIG